MINATPTRFFLLIVFFSVVHAQDPARVPIEVPNFFYHAFMTKTGSASWGYGGVDVVGNDSTIFPYINPALMSVERYIVAIEFANNESARGPFIFKFDNRVLIPSYAVILLPLRGWNVAAGYSNYYNLRIVFDPIPIRTIQQPGGTGEYINAENNIQLHTFFGAVQYQIHPKFSVGINLGTTYYRRREKISRIEAKADAWSWKSVVGIAYTPYERLTFGASLRYLHDIDFTIKTNTGEVLAGPDLDPGGNNDSIVATLQHDFTGEARFPWEIRVGLSYQFHSLLQIFAMINLQEWSRVNNSVQDQQQFHIGLQARLYRATAVSAGFFTQWEGSEGEYTLEKYLHQDFLTLGISQQFLKRFQFNFSIMDSRLFAEPEEDFNRNGDVEEFFQTKILLGLKYTFI